MCRTYRRAAAQRYANGARRKKNKHITNKNSYGPMSFELLSVFNIFWAAIVAHSEITAEKCSNARKPNPTKSPIESENREGESEKKNGKTGGKNSSSNDNIMISFDGKFHHRTHTNAVSFAEHRFYPKYRFS